MIKDVEGLAKKAPTYVTDFESWAEDNKQFAELNEKYDLTDKLSEQASSLPSKLGDGATALGNATVSVLEHLLAAITILTLTVFLLLEGKGMFERGTGRLDKPHRDRARRVGTRIAAVVRSYVSVNLMLAIGAGLLHLDLPRDPRLPPRDPDGAAGRLPGPCAADRAHDRRPAGRGRARDRRPALRRSAVARRSSSPTSSCRTA